MSRRSGIGSIVSATASTAVVEGDEADGIVEEAVLLSDSAAVGREAGDAAALKQRSNQGEEGEGREEKKETEDPDKFRQRRTNVIVCGFGEERVDNLVAHSQRRDREGLQRARAREEDFVRGKMVDMQGNELDRSVGTAFHI